MKPNGLTFTLIALGLAFITRPMRAQAITFFRQFITPAIDQATAVAANASGIYVIGSRQAAPAGAGISKYDSLGNELWTREIGVPERRSPTPYARSGDAVHFAVVIGAQWTGFQSTVAVR